MIDLILVWEYLKQYFNDFKKYLNESFRYLLFGFK
jgi:hypothetical protein